MRYGIRLTLLVAVAVAVAVALLSASLAGAAGSPPFKLGVYKGSTNLHGQVKMRIWKGHCDRYRQNTVQVSGYCFVITRLTPVPRSHCADQYSQQQADGVTLAPYGSDPEKIHLAPSGRYHDSVDTYGSGPKPITEVKISFVAKGKKVTGSVVVKAGGDGNGHFACTAPKLTFTAHR